MEDAGVVEVATSAAKDGGIGRLGNSMGRGASFRWQATRRGRESMLPERNGTDGPFMRWLPHSQAFVALLMQASQERSPLGRTALLPMALDDADRSTRRFPMTHEFLAIMLASGFDGDARSRARAAACLARARHVRIVDAWASKGRRANATESPPVRPFAAAQRAFQCRARPIRRVVDHKVTPNACVRSMPGCAR